MNTTIARTLLRIVILAGILLVILLLIPQIAQADSATLGVDVTLDSNDPVYQACTSAPNDCSLRGAISHANANPATDFTIQVPAGTFTLTLAGAEEEDNATGDLDIKVSVILQGSGMETTILQAGETKGDGIDRVLNVRDGALSVQMSKFTIQNGEVKDDKHGGGLFVSSGNANVTLTQVFFKNNVGEGYSSGGGLSTWGVYTAIYDCIFSGNENAGEGGAVYQASGTVEFNRTTMMNNTAKYGGGFANNSSATMNNVTISGNTATIEGGGISQWNSGDLTINYTTIANNTSPGSNTASVIQNTRSFKAYNSILVAPDGKKTCSKAMTDGSYNLASDAVCVSGITVADPLLGSLQNNGGYTWTHSLAYNSPAIDAADPSNCSTEDQRSILRPIDGNGDGVAKCDIGAYERTIMIFVPLVNR